MKKWIQKIFNTTPTPKNGWVDAKDEVEALIFMFNSNNHKQFHIQKSPNGGIILYYMIHPAAKSEIVFQAQDYEQLFLTISYFGFKYFEQKWD
jgi:hypothetical protein